MRKNRIYLLLLLSCCLGCNSKQHLDKENAMVKMPEDEAITKAVADAYAAISFKKGEEPNYGRIRDYFVPNAQFNDFRNDSLESLGLDQFTTAYKNFIESEHINSFFEKEVFGKTDQFGRIAQRISTYETYINGPDTLAQRGVNSFQLLKTKDGWKVSSIIWDIETAAHPVPGYFLNVDSLNKTAK